jgi:hypothetical protein
MKKTISRKLIDKDYRLWIINIVLILLLNSCFFPCNLGVSGKVINQDDNNPLDSVLIKVYDDGDYFMEFYTDSTGTFEANSNETHSAFLGGKCKELKLEFSKAGFTPETYSTQNGDGNVTIYMHN